MKKFVHFRRAFTLIELMVVIAIIGILATLITVNLQGAQAKSRDTKRKSDVSMIMSAIVMYGTDHGGVLPATDYSIETSSAGGGTLDSTVGPNGGRYIEQMPIDPKCHGDKCDSAPASSNTGYRYYRADYLFSNPVGCAGIPASYNGNQRKGFVYASLEKTDSDSTNSMSDYAGCAVKTIYSYDAGSKVGPYS